MSAPQTSPTTLSTDSVNNFARTTSNRRGAPQWPLTALLLATLGFALAQAAAGETAKDTTSYLLVETVPDGRCHNLSEGGKLVVLRNTHPTKSIRYRLLRLFIGRPQGLMDGSITTADGPQKLGCDKVGGRAQTWQIKRASFAPE